MSVAPAHKEVFGRLYHSVWNERRLEFIDKIIAKSHALGDPTLSGGAVGPSAYRRQVERFQKALPDLKFSIDETVSEKDKLVVAWTITGNAPRRASRDPGHQQESLGERNHHQPDCRRKNPGVDGGMGRRGAHAAAGPRGSVETGRASCYGPLVCRCTRSLSFRPLPVLSPVGSVFVAESSMPPQHKRATSPANSGLHCVVVP